MHNRRAAFLLVLALVVAAGCGTSTSAGNVSTPPLSMSFAVGTLNDSGGTITGTAGTYLNAVAAFRNQFGSSAALTPGNGYVTLPNGQNFIVGGLFSYGQNPSSLTSATLLTGQNLVFGLPPAYSPANQNGIGYATGFLYYFTDATLSTFKLPPTPIAGTYALSTVLSANGQNQPYAKSAVLPSTATLGAEPTPVYASGGATGGGTFTVAPPARVSETLVVILSSGAEVATVLTHNGSAIVPAGTLTLGTAYNAYSVGADYPLFEAGPPINTSQTPTLAGPSGTADLTVSGMSSFTQ